MINKIGNSISNLIDTFNKTSYNILKDTTGRRKGLIEDIVDSIEIKNFTKYNIKALKTYDQMLGTVLDIKK